MSTPAAPTQAPSDPSNPASNASTATTATPIRVTLSPRALSDLAKTQTTVTFPSNKDKNGLDVTLARGDLFVLGLKKKGGADASVAGGSDKGKSSENEAKTGKENTGGGNNVKSDDKKGKDKKTVTDPAPIGGTYELALVSLESEELDSVIRVLGIVYRNLDEDMVKFHLLPHTISHCELFFHSKSVGKTGGRFTLHSFIHGHGHKDKDGLELDDDDWGQIKDGSLLSMTPGSVESTNKGWDIALEITFKSSHPHDTKGAFALAKEIFSGKHDSFAGSSSSCGCEDGNCESKGSVREKGSEVVTIGSHIAVHGD